MKEFISSVTLKWGHEQDKMSAASNQQPVEWLDIVDSEDRIIGAAPRGIVHKKAYMHRAVHIMLSNSAGQVFLQQRSHDKDTNPGLWDTSCAGHIDSGESVSIAAVRELTEELGITISTDALLERSRLTPSHENGFEHVTLYTAISDDPLTLCPTEIIDGKWLSPTALDNWLVEEPRKFTRTFQVIWHEIRHYL